MQGRLQTNPRFNSRTNKYQTVILCECVGCKIGKGLERSKNSLYIEDDDL